MSIFKSLIDFSLDGEWGTEQIQDNSTKMIVVRGTDFENFSLGNLEEIPQRFISNNQAQRKSLCPNDILMETAGGSTNTPTGRTILVKEEIIKNAKIPITCSSFARFIRINKKKVNPQYVFWYLQYLYKFGRIKEFQVQHTGISRFQYTVFSESINIPIPNETKQKYIVKLFSNIEEKILYINKINKKLNDLNLLIFNNFFLSSSINCNIKTATFGELIKELKEKINENIQENYKVLSAVNTGLLIPSDEYFSKQVFSKDLSKYKVLEQYDFAYNPARVNIGSIGMLDKPIKGCVSPVYIAFRAKPNWHYFIDFMIKQPHIKKMIEVYCSGSVRQVLRFEDFCRIEIKLPPEQKVLEFNEIYQSILNKINHNKQHIEKLTALRDTVLPKLMTGKIEIKNYLC